MDRPTQPVRDKCGVCPCNTPADPYDEDQSMQYGSGADAVLIHTTARCSVDLNVSSGSPPPPAALHPAAQVPPLSEHREDEPEEDATVTHGLSRRRSVAMDRFIEGKTSSRALQRRSYYHFFAMAILVLAVVNVFLPFAFLEGKPFLGTCRYGRWGTRVRAIVYLIPTALVEAPVCAWMLSRASTPYLRQVSHYVVVLWFHQSLNAWFQSTECFSGSTAISNQVLVAATSFTVMVSQVLILRLVLGRLVALELSSLMDFHSRCLTRGALIWGSLAAITVIIAPRLGYPVGGVIVSVLVMVFVLWVVAALRAFASAKRLVSRAASLTTGRRQQEAELATKAVTMQLAGMIATFASTLSNMVAWMLVRGFGMQSDGLFVLQTCLALIDAKANLFGAVALSGALAGALAGGRAQQQEDAERETKLHHSRKTWKPNSHSGWQGKIEELAHKGFTLEKLLKFYTDDLPRQMPNFNPRHHRTLDVVRCAIIPLSSETSEALATVMMDGVPTLPMKMVTHNWGNKFRDLVAAILADALDEDEYMEIAYLMDTNMPKLVEWAQKKGVAQHRYWVCAFSVNQHSGICGANPFGDKDPVTDQLHPVCTCAAPKYFNTDAPLNQGRSVNCEMNKFDEMMSYLAKHVTDFSQVIAVDVALDLFSRAWCVSELAKAYATGMKQHLKLIDFRAVAEHENRLKMLKVQNMSATRPQDVEEILAGIPDKDAFNRQLQTLLFEKLIPAWNNLDSREQMNTIGRIARWQAVDQCRSESLYVDRQDGDEDYGGPPLEPSFFSV